MGNEGMFGAGAAGTGFVVVVVEVVVVVGVVVVSVTPGVVLSVVPTKQTALMFL